MAKSQSNNNRIILAVIGAAAFIGLLAMCGSRNETAQETVAEAPAWQPPEGYDAHLTRDGQNFGFRWMKTDEFACDLEDFCYGSEMVFPDGCPGGLYAEVTLLDANEVNVGWTNETAKSVRPDEKVRLIFGHYEDGVKYARLGEVSCKA